MKARLISTIVLWTSVVLGLVYGRSTGVVWLVALFSAAATWETLTLFRSKASGVHRVLGTVVGGLLTPVAHYCPSVGAESMLVGLAILCCLDLLRAKPGERNPMGPAATVFGVIYVAYLFNFLVRLVALPGTDSAAQLLGADTEGQGLALGLWTVIVVKFTDAGALVAGMTFGRHLFSPTISPKKTWEGVVGGVLTAIALGVGLRAGFPSFFPSGFSVAEAAIIALPLSMLGVLADLVESVLKREAGAKDSGRTIPGIGGALDLVDSLLLTAPVAYWLFRAVL